MPSLKGRSINNEILSARLKSCPDANLFTTKFLEVGHDFYENDVPQPHDFFAFGFWKTKPWCMSVSS
jgi:hypothetical protein